MMAMQVIGGHKAARGGTSRWTASKAIIGLLILAISWFIGGMILEDVLKASLFATMIFWVVFFGILVAMFAGMIIAIYREIKWTEGPPRSRGLRTISLARGAAILGASIGAANGAEHGLYGAVFFGIFFGVLCGIFGAIVGYFKNKGD